MAKDPKYIKINVDFKEVIRVIEKLLKELWDVFPQNYIEFWKITPNIVEHKIELDIIIPFVHQKKFKWTPIM
jgi:hypothetical protein